jgi:hypothetical protein
MVVFPAISALISLACAGLTARDAAARPRPDKTAWTIAFALFAVAAGAEVIGSLGSWNTALARIYYLTGAVLVVGFLALGELYLLAGKRIGGVAPGAALLLTAAAATLVLNSDIDRAKLADDGWEALDRGPALTALTIGINALGTAVIAGGLVYSAWRFKRLGVQRERMIGCLLIALGTLTVATGGTLTRLGHRELLYVPMAIGVAIIFAGYLQTRRPVAAAARPAGAPAVASAHVAASDAVKGEMVVRNGHGRLRPTWSTTNGRQALPGATHAEDPGIAFIEANLNELEDEALSELCRVWSAERRETDAFQREEARRAWELRTRLSPMAQERFDALPVAVRLQLTTLYHEVIAPECAGAGSGR